MDPSVSTGENPDSNENNPQESESESNNSRSDALGKALSTMLANVIKDLDSKAQDTLNSQDKLNSAIDRLTRELDQLLEDAPLPFIMQHAAKISGVRKRVSSLNSVLKSIQKRVDNIDRLLSAGMEDNSGQLIATLVLVLKAQARRRTLKVVLALLWATRSYGEVAAMTLNAMLLVNKKDRQKVLMGFA